MRGIVISPVEIIGKNSMRMNGSIDPIRLRQYLLYWDKIEFPQSNIIGFGDTPEISYLKNVNVLSQSRVNVVGSGEMTDLFLRGQFLALQMHNEKEKGCWSLGQSNANLVLAKDESVLSRNIEVELIEGLPSPTLDVSLEDILNFKERRRDELLEFRNVMDNLYLEISSTNDSERSLVKNIVQLQRKVIELNRVMNESRIKSVLKNLKVEVDFSQMFKNTVGAMVAGKTFGFPVGISGAVGFASSFIKLSSEVSLKPKKIPDGLKDYAYLYYANNELI